MRFRALSAIARLMLTSCLGASAFSGGYVKPSIPMRAETLTRHGKRNGTVAQAKRAALKERRRKEHRMHCR